MAAPTATVVGSNQATSGSTITITLSATIAAGHTIAIGAWNRNARTISSISDSAGNTYTVPAGANIAASMGAGMAYCLNPAALGIGDTITVTFSGSVSGSGAAAMSLGATCTLDANSLDEDALNGDISLTSGGSVATDVRMLAMCAYGNTTNRAVPSGWDSTLYEVTSGSRRGELHTLATTGAGTVTLSQSVGRDIAAAMLGLAAAGGGPTYADGAGTSAGTSTSSGAGAASSATSGASAGTATATGAGNGIGDVSGAAAGVATTSASAIALSDTAGASAGGASASGAGSVIADAGGASSGAAAASGAGASTAATAGASSGSASASGAGAATAIASGSAAGASTATGVGSSVISGDTGGSAAGASTASGAGAAIVAAAGFSAGSATATAAGLAVNLAAEVKNRQPWAVTVDLQSRPIRSPDATARPKRGTVPTYPMRIQYPVSR